MKSRARSFATVLLASSAVVFVVLVSASPAAAHTGFESSSPADGDVVVEPVSEIALTFSGEATPTGEGFVVLDPTGTIREPDEIVSADNLTWILRFDEPLAGGDIGVRWMVAAPDAHPIDGSFSFTVTAAAAAPAPAPAPEIEQPTPVTQTEDAAPATEEPPDATNEPPGDADAEPPHQADVGESGTGSEDSEPVDLESFLDTSGAAPTAVDAIDSVARILSVLGALLAIGGTAFAAFVLRGDPSDIHLVLTWVRRGGILLLIGAIAEAATTTATLAGQWSALTSTADLGDALRSSTGLAIAFRAGGGFLTAALVTSNTITAGTGGDPVMAARRLATVGGGHHTSPAPDGETSEPFVYPEDHKWNPGAGLGGIVGVALVAVSFVFDGHTASEGPRWLHVAANLVHVTTAAIWAGGIAMLALTMRRRRRTNRPTQALQLAMRFSVVATAALASAGVAGTALTLIVIDSVSDLWSTPWGLLLIAKIAIVAVAAAGGAYNHRIMIPALNQNANDRATIGRFRTVVTLEAAALVTVAIITAFLIAASST